jgi:hypothetical protein
MTEKDTKKTTTSTKKSTVEMESGTRSKTLPFKANDPIHLTYISSSDVNIGGLELTWKNREGSVPKNLSDEDKEKLRKLIENGTITVGKLGSIGDKNPAERFTEADESVITKCKTMMDSIAEVRELCSGLVRCGTHIGGWHPKEILEKLVHYENSNRSRLQVIQLLNTAIENMRFVSFRSVAFDPKIHATSDINYTESYNVGKTRA